MENEKNYRRPLCWGSPILSGIPSIDLILGSIPSTGYTEIHDTIDSFSNENSSGKTSLALQFIRENSKNKRLSIYIDLEENINKRILNSRNIDTDYLLIIKGYPNIDIPSIVQEFPETNLIVIDSLPCLEIEKHKKLLRLLDEVNQGSKIILNQARNNLQLKQSTVFSNTAVKQWCYCILSIKKSFIIRKDLEIIGKTLLITNREKEILIPLLFKSGISEHMDLITLARKNRILETKGKHIYLDTNLIGSSYKQAVSRIREDKTLYNNVYERLKICLK